MMSELIETDLTIADNINYLMDAMAKPEVTKEEVHAFLNAHRSIDRIVKIEGDYNDNKMSVFYRDEQGRRHVRKEDFYPFLWCKQSAARQFFKGDRKLLISKMDSYGISCKGLRVHDTEGNIHPRMENGYRVMFFARVPMSYTHFLEFFSDAGRPVFPKQSDPNYGQREYITVAPVEQFMIATGYRMFKGYNDYDELKRFIFDLETEGLEADKHRISQIGVRTNKGFEKIIKVEGEGQEKLDNELNGIEEFFDIIRREEPDIIAGYNSENFDFPFIDIALQRRHETSLSDFTNPKFGGKGFFKSKKQKVLKLGGEMEYYYPTIFYGHNITDGLFAVRRAQAIDSNMKEAGLKYVTKYSKINKPNRVYLPGKIINETWSVKERVYAFNDEDGEWFRMTDALLNKTYTVKENDTEISRPKYTLSEDGETLFDVEKNKSYVFVSGEYIGERYLKDDLWETDKIEYRYNLPNFLVGKMLPVQFDKMCTMGTAAIWKYLLLAWSYEHDLAVPELIETKQFTGGLSRLLSVGYVDRIVKLDFNSLYPSILLTFNIKSPIDVMGVMLAMLEYILSQREHYKELKGDFGGKAKKTKKQIEAKNYSSELELRELQQSLADFEREASLNDKLQLPLKITGNGFFGSFGSGVVFPWSDLSAAEETTCTGRMMLRLMISHFTRLGYKPIVGDTDGFNFRIADELRYNEENPYISDGGGRNSVKGKAYTGIDADVAEFEDMYMHSAFNGGINKNGLGIDEYCDSTINFARKNYADLMPDGKVKLVGNTIKSKKMPKYIEKFLSVAISLLLHGKGKDFLEYYYDYVEKIFNLQIPLKDIASVGKIKTSIENYKEACKQLTAGGTKKARQAWYELAIRDGLNVNMGETIYYINTGNKKGSSDVQRITRYFIENRDGQRQYDAVVDGVVLTDKKGNPVSLNKDIERRFDKFKKEYKAEHGDKVKIPYTMSEFAKTIYPDIKEEDEVIFNCVRLSNEIVEDEDDHFCDENFEYNSEKYIDMFNKRIRPLLVCFNREMRTRINEKGKEVDNILISNPKDRKTFTEAESVLVSGQPYNTGDQDTYEQLMTMEDKEIKFWLSVNKVPPYVVECGINWEEVKADYLERMKVMEQDGIREEVERYNDIINELKRSDVDALIEDGILPEKLLKFIDEDMETGDLVSKKYSVKIGTIFDFIDKDFSIDRNWEE